MSYSPLVMQKDLFDEIATRHRFMVWAPIVIFVIALALRIFNVGGSPLSNDEAYTVFIARQPLRHIAYGEFFLDQPIFDPHPRFYYILMHFWLVLGESEFVLRLFSVIVGMLSLWVLYRLGQKLFGDLAGMLAAFLLAISPFHIAYSRNARMYSLAVFLALVSTYCLIRALRSQRGRYWLYYMLATALALQTANQVWILLLVQSIYSLSTLRRYQMSIVQWLVILSGVILLCSPAIPLLWYQLRHADNLTASYSIAGSRSFFKPTLAIPASFAYGVYDDLPGARVLAKMLLLYIGPLVLLLALRFLSSPRLPPHAVGLVLLWLAVPFGWALVQNNWAAVPMQARHLSWVLPAWVLMLAAGVAAIKANLFRGMILFLFVALHGLNLLAFYTGEEVLWHGDWRGACRSVRGQSQADDLVLFADQIQPAYRYYMPEDLQSSTVAVSVFNNWEEPRPPRHQVEEELAGHVSDRERVWYFKFVSQLTDPEGIVPAWLLAHGFERQPVLHIEDQEPRPALYQYIVPTETTLAPPPAEATPTANAH